ncbi:EF-hand domain-containing protein [Oceanidesulfovibrio indonesiensis]|nr:EF-hand domain-containing protein [Oceanidesulfovibrio indonesiensis]
MRTQIFRIALAFMAAATFALAPAAHAGSGKYFAEFEDMDANGDGIVEMDEFTEHFKDNADPAGAFSIIDRDSDGTLDKEEWDSFMKVHGHGGGMKGKGDAHGMENPHGKMGE